MSLIYNILQGVKIYNYTLNWSEREYVFKKEVIDYIIS